MFFPLQLYNFEKNLRASKEGKKGLALLRRQNEREKAFKMINTYAQREGEREKQFVQRGRMKKEGEKRESL